MADKMSDEAESAIREAEIEMEAHRLGVFTRNPENREALDKRVKELQKKSDEWTWHNELDLLTQGALASVLFGIVKHSEEEPLDQLKRIFAMGYTLGKEKKA